MAIYERDDACLQARSLLFWATLASAIICSTSRSSASIESSPRLLLLVGRVISGCRTPSLNHTTHPLARICWNRLSLRLNAFLHWHWNAANMKHSQQMDTRKRDEIASRVFWV